MIDFDGSKKQAAAYLHLFKRDAYVFGLGCFGRIGALVAATGRRAAVVADGMGMAWAAPAHAALEASLNSAGVALAGPFIPGAQPNAPREDVFRIAAALRAQEPDVVVALGGGSVIDAAKGAVAYAALGDRHPDIGGYFGVGQVAAKLAAENRTLLPLVAVQLVASSGAHLTKYANITDMATGQKLLIVDDAVVPPRALFDYAVTASTPPALTTDGALDGVSHCLEVFMGLAGPALEQARPVCLKGIELIVHSIKACCADPGSLPAREALGLGTDLGGYAIMIGGTNGAHLTSFSLVDILPHGRACAVMNPYYVVFFAPAIEEKLRAVAAIYRDAGYLKADAAALKGRDLGIAVAEAMIALSKDVGFPATLGEVPGFTDAHVARALAAAKNPQLESKLKNMPVPLSAGLVDEYMAPILAAARTGDFSLVRNMG
ncbi:iron-containing alcohol dehydrogenase [bacterium]|nr:iron-containing alcohol dehydrogenase [bacterium]